VSRRLIDPDVSHGSPYHREFYLRV
jgi:hypothetical protein